MYRIGEFSILSKITIKALRYYEKERLLIPSYIDNETGYRFYESIQLLELNKIIALRQIGMSIDNIKNILKGDDLNSLLLSRKKELETELSISENQLSRINYLLEEKEMKYEAIIKELPDYLVYYKEGIINNFSELSDFILSSAEEVKANNPNLKCIEPDYCYVSYLDGEYKEKDIHIIYAQAVTEEGMPNDTIRFKALKSTKAVSIYHRGSYDRLGEAYAYGIKWLENNGYEMSELPRERYIDGIWNKEDKNDWVTEIQFPVKNK